MKKRRKIKNISDQKVIFDSEMQIECKLCVKVPVNLEGGSEVFRVYIERHDFVQPKSMCNPYYRGASYCVMPNVTKQYAYPYL